MRPEDMILISVDDHIAEPMTMFEQHVPARYRDKAPRVVEDANGKQQWMYGDLRGRPLGLNAVAGKRREFYNFDATRYDEMRPGCYDVHERVRDMSAGGQLAGLNFPNWPGFSGQVLSKGPDTKLNEIMIKAYNDWHVLEWCGAYPDRFIPCGVVPLFDAEAAAAEVHRLAAMGCHAITFSENPEALDRPTIHSGYWDPLFAACHETQTVVCMHLGSSSRALDISSDAPPSVPMSLLALRTVNTLVEFIWSDIFTKFPTLKISLTEGDIGWIPYFIQRSNHVLERHSGWTKAEFPGNGDPESVFRNHVLCCFIDDPVGLDLLDHFNIDNVMWESDFPHSDSCWPNGPEMLSKHLAGKPDALVNKLSHENAMRHYAFDPFSTKPREECTVAALRASAADVDTNTYVGHEANESDLAAWEQYRQTTSMTPSK